MTTPLNLSCCTLTGVDERTDLTEVADLSRDFPVAEWGFLYSPKRQGQPGRYPSINFLHNTLQSLPDHVRVALHVCGQGVPDLLAGEKVISKLAMLVAVRGGRIQLNFNHARDSISLGALHDFLDQFPALTVITQHNEANAALWQEFQRYRNHALLFDASGGRGIKADHWPDILPVSCGYAGGLGQDNLHKSLEQLAQVAGQRSFWVDMEGSLRVTDANGHDWLDTLRCEHCLEIAQDHVPLKKVEVAADEGWWVPDAQFYGQKALPLTGSWQKVRCHTGVVVEACLLAGQDGWYNGNYEPVDGIQEWLKPARWFRGVDDLVGNVAAVAAYKASLSRSPLRGTLA